MARDSFRPLNARATHSTHSSRENQPTPPSKQTGSPVERLTFFDAGNPNVAFAVRRPAAEDEARNDVGLGASVVSHK